MTYQPYPHHEPRHFRPPDVGYERPVLSPLEAPRLPPLGRMTRTPDPSYMLSADSNYLNRSPLPQTLPLRMHHPVPTVVHSHDYNAPYLEGSNPMIDHGHEYPSHRLRTYDQESQ
jgi:hypothetical protein